MDNIMDIIDHGEKGICPHCGSENWNSYGSTGKLYCKCHDCGIRWVEDDGMIFTNKDDMK